MTRRFAILLLFACTTLYAAAPLPEAKPEEVGLSAPRLARVDAMIKKAIESGDFPGAVTAIARKGKLVYYKSHGVLDKSNNTAMNTDAIFRIYSMTKPIVSVAAMMLVEEGKLGLHEPISKYLPEFKEMKVVVENQAGKTDAAAPELVAAKRQITVQDLLRHTSGLTYGMLGDKSAVKELYKQAGIGTLEQFYTASPPWTNQTFAQAIAKLPLRYEPGSTWEYGHSTDVLGRLVEVVAGQPLDVVLAERIFKPLKMNDTAFQVPAEKAGRIAQPQKDAKTGETPNLIDVTKPTTWFAAGHGLTSTAGDYLRFTQMLLNDGELDGVQILSRKTVEYMATNHVTSNIDTSRNFNPGPGYGFGLGFGVREEAGMSEWQGSPGEYYWGGYGGTYFFVDPDEQLTALMMFQNPAVRMHYRVLFRSVVLQSIMD